MKKKTNEQLIKDLKENQEKYSTLVRKSIELNGKTLKAWTDSSKSWEWLCWIGYVMGFISGILIGLLSLIAVLISL